MNFTRMEYKLTKFICQHDSVRPAALLWGCTMRTIINRLKAYEIMNCVEMSERFH